LINLNTNSENSILNQRKSKNRRNLEEKSINISLHKKTVINAIVMFVERFINLIMENVIVIRENYERMVPAQDAFILNV